MLRELREERVRLREHPREDHPARRARDAQEEVAEFERCERKSPFLLGELACFARDEFLREVSASERVEGERRGLTSSGMDFPAIRWRRLGICSISLEIGRAHV